jgi:hypothetical protein
MKTLVAAYEHLYIAELVVHDLERSGFERNQINLIANVVDDEYRPYLDERGLVHRDRGHHERSSDKGEQHETRLGLTSLLAGLGLLMIPALGPVLAIGPLLGGAVAGGAGAASSTLPDILIDAGVFPSDAEAFVSLLKAGRTLLIVGAREDQVDRARQMMGRRRPLDALGESSHARRLRGEGPAPLPAMERPRQG